MVDKETKLTIRVKNDSSMRSFFTNIEMWTYDELKEISKRDKHSLAEIVRIALKDFVIKHK